MILIFACVALIALTLTRVVPVAPVQRAGGIVIVPMQSGINRIGTWLQDRSAALQDVRALTSENKELKDRIAALESENTELSQGKDELDRLRELYQLDTDFCGKCGIL